MPSAQPLPDGPESIAVPKPGRRSAGWHYKRLMFLLGLVVKFQSGRRTRAERAMGLTPSALWLLHYIFLPQVKAMLKNNKGYVRIDPDKILSRPGAPGRRAYQEAIKRLKAALPGHFGLEIIESGFYCKKRQTWVRGLVIQPIATLNTSGGVEPRHASPDGCADSAPVPSASPKGDEFITRWKREKPSRWGGGPRMSRLAYHQCRKFHDYCLAEHDIFVPVCRLHSWYYGHLLGGEGLSEMDEFLTSGLAYTLSVREKSPTPVDGGLLVWRVRDVFPCPRPVEARKSLSFRNSVARINANFEAHQRSQILDEIADYERKFPGEPLSHSLAFRAQQAKVKIDFRITPGKPQLESFDEVVARLLGPGFVAAAS